MSGNSSRKPSGSSTRSATHSPRVQTTAHFSSQRKISPASTTTMLGVGLGGATMTKGMNTTWQVWGSGSASSISPSLSPSAPIYHDLPPPLSDTVFTPATSVPPWTSPRPNWNDPSDGSQLQSNPTYAFPSRPRQGQSVPFSAPATDDRSMDAGRAPIALVSHDNSSNVDAGAIRHSTPGHPPPPPKAFGTILQPIHCQLGYEPQAMPPSPHEIDVTAAFRGMAVSDDEHDRHQPGLGLGHIYNPQLHGSPPSPLVPFGTYPPPFYGNPGLRESYDYPYGLGPNNTSSYPPPSFMVPPGQPIFQSVGPQSMPLNNMPEFNQQAYEFGSRSINPPFYYPTPQPPLYPGTLAIMNPRMGPVVPASKNAPYNTRLTHNLLYGPMVRSTTQMHPYNASIAMMHPGIGPYAPNLAIPASIPRHFQSMNRSHVLDEFRVNKSRCWELNDVWGHIVEFSSDQHGSRFIQTKIENATVEEKNAVFDEIVPYHTLELMRDVFGNYVIQKLFEHGTQKQITILANAMDGHVLHFSLDMYGCRVVQKAIECTLPDQQGRIVAELEPHMLKCVKDPHGNHVIQKIIERLGFENIAFVLSFQGHVFELASHPYGCRVLQRCFENLPDTLTRPLLDELHTCSLDLMQDQFGNYIIQYLIEAGPSHDQSLIISSLRTRFLDMARHKFASNVCEKALVCADPETRHGLIDDIMSSKSDGPRIVPMMRDQYANYVLQRALAVVDDDQKTAFFNKVRPHLANVRRVPGVHNKHLVSMEKLLDR